MRQVISIILLCLSGLAHAASFTVINTNDSGVGSLRQAIINANGSGAGPHTITYTNNYPQFGATSLQSDLPVIAVSPVTIDGGGRTPVIDGGANWSILQAGLNVNLTVSGMNFQFGVAENGGCIATQFGGGSGTLSVTNSFFTGCTASDAGLAGGGAIFWSAQAGGFLSINDSGFFDNTVNTTDIATEQPRGGAILAVVTTSINNTLFRDNGVNSTGNRGGYGGAVMIFSPDGAFNEINGSTFDANTVDSTVTSLGWGGAMRVFLPNGALLQLVGNFFTDNSARFGGAVFVDAPMLSDTTQLAIDNNSFNQNSATVAGGAMDIRDNELFARHNTWFGGDAPSGSDLALERVKVSTFVHNVLADTLTSPACDLSNVDTAGSNFAGNLFAESCGDLSATGGSISNNLEVMEIDTAPPVGVVKFLPGTDPIDGGTSNPSDCLSVDARGNPRPQDGDDDGDPVCDVGAYESPLIPVLKDGFEDA